MTKQTLMEFPCTFPIKVIGNHTPTFIDELKQISLKHFPDFNDNDLKQKISQKSNYLAITLSVYAENQQMLDAFYEKLIKLPDVKMVL